MRVRVDATFGVGIRVRVTHASDSRVLYNLHIIQKIISPYKNIQHRSSVEQHKKSINNNNNK